MSSRLNKTKLQIQSEVSNIKKTLNKHYTNSFVQSNLKPINSSYQPLKTQNIGYNDYVVVMKKDTQNQKNIQLEMKRVTEHIQTQNYLNDVLEKRTINLQNLLEKSQIKLNGQKQLAQSKLFYTQRQLERVETNIISLNQKIQTLTLNLNSLQIQSKQKNQIIVCLKKHNEQLQSQISVLKRQKNQLQQRISHQIQQRIQSEQNQKIAKHDLKLSIRYSQNLQTAMIKRETMNSKQQRQFRVIRNLYMQNQKSQKDKYQSQRKPYFQMIEDLSQLKSKLKLPEEPEEDQKHHELRKTIQNFKKQIIDLKHENSILNQRVENYFKIKQVSAAQENLILKLESQIEKQRKQMYSLKLKQMQNQLDSKYMRSTGYNFFTNDQNSSKEDFKQYFKVKFDIYERRKIQSNGSSSNIGKLYSP